MRLDSGDLVSFLDFCERKSQVLETLVLGVVIIFHFTLFFIFKKKSLFHYSSWSLTVSFRFWWDCRDCRFAKDHLNDAKGSISSMDRQEESLLRTALAAWKELRPQLGGVTQMLHDARECCFQTFTARRRVEQFWCGIERCLRVINRGKMWYIWSFVLVFSII